MDITVFSQLTFWLLIGFSFVLPIGIYALLLLKRAIARHTVLLLGIVLIVIAAVDIYLLQRLATMAKITPSLSDDAVFLSEVSLALYLIPVVFVGIGINVISHILVQHLVKAEQRFQDEHPGERSASPE
jgi:arginine exporter protein ArgO